MFLPGVSSSAYGTSLGSAGVSFGLSSFVYNLSNTAATQVYDARLGGDVPKAILVFGAAADLAGTVSTSDTVQSLLGACDRDLSQYGITSADRHLATTKFRFGGNNAAIMAATYSASYATLVTPVTRLLPNAFNYDCESSAGANADRYLGCLMLGGRDLTAKVGRIATPSTGGTTVTLGFRPDVLFIFSHNTTNGSSANMNGMHGFVVFDHTTSPVTITQRGFYYGNNGDTNHGTHYTESGCGGQATGTTSDYTTSVTAVSSTGFTFAPSASAGSSDDFGYLALKLSAAGAKAKTGTVDLTSGTGSQAVTGLGFQPEILMFWLHASTSSPISTGNWSFAVKTASDFVGLYRFSEVGSGGNMRMVGSASSLQRPNGSGTIVSDYAITSLDSDGFTVNKITSPADAKLFYLALKTE